MNPKLMGVVNVTPDSFSDGGRYLDADAAVRHGEELVREGAAILDIGGESTRPGAPPGGEGGGVRRVLPVGPGVGERGATISIDPSKVVVAEAALEVGASIVNDVTGFKHEPEM